MNTVNILQIGQIRHPIGQARKLIKCLGPFENDTIQDENIPELEILIPLYRVPKYHYFVIIKFLKNYVDPNHDYCLVRLITHSGDEFDNLKITSDLYHSAKIKNGLSKSFISRNLFIILIKDINVNKLFGNFDIERLNIALKTN